MQSLTHDIISIGMFQLAAQRVANYWESRRQVFGPEKYLMRMALSEALCDDLTALETGFYCLLPHLDLSGRQIIYLEPHRHTKEGYTRESLVRIMSHCKPVNAMRISHTCILF